MVLSPADMARLFDGVLEGDAAATVLTGVTTDSREVTPRGVFVAVRGAVDDGHRFVDAAARAGAALAVVDASWVAPRDAAVPPLLLRVDDTAAALRRACTARLRELGCTVVGITGSAGKTTAKELCALALGAHAVARTEGNLNTWTGIPLCVLRLQPPVEVFVAEMAMSARGEIADLCSFTHPRIGVLLNVGLAHVGLLGSAEAIADAKAELLDALPPDGLAVCNADDPLVRSVLHRSRARALRFGVHAEDAEVHATDVRAEGLGGTRCVLHTPDGSAELRLAAPGMHVVLDACAAAAVAWHRGVGVEEIARRLSGFTAPEQRGTVRPGCNGAVVYDDSYNSSPTSLAAALDVLAASGARRRIAILGDMKELGEHAARAHEDAGRHAARAATVLIAVGAHAPLLVAAAVDAGMPAPSAHVAGDVDDAARLARELCDADTAVLVKASHSVALERVVARLVA